jgi:hypothetical protein
MMKTSGLEKIAQYLEYESNRTSARREWCSMRDSLISLSTEMFMEREYVLTYTAA